MRTLRERHVPPRIGPKCLNNDWHDRQLQGPNTTYALEKRVALTRDFANLLDRARRTDREASPRRHDQGTLPDASIITLRRTRAARAQAPIREVKAKYL